MSILTVYPDAGNPGTTSCDGSIELTDATWATVRGAADGATVRMTVASASCHASWFDPIFRIHRLFFLFDSSALTAAATISAAVLSLAASGSGKGNDDTSTINIVASTPASNTALVVGDYDQVGATSFGSKTIANWVDTNNTYNDFTLDANGISNISKTGISKFAVRINRDLSNLEPTGDNHFEPYMADQAATTSDPKLVITYTASSIKTFSGVATASVKTVNGVAIASVKTWGGVA